MALFPYSNFHDINLDWIVGKLKKAVFTINGQAPDSEGNVNLSQVSGVTTVNGVGADGAGNVQLTPADVNALPDSYSAPVQSVQGKVGNVILSASDVNAMPIGYVPPVASVNGKTGAVVLDASDVGALPDTYAAPVDMVNGQTGTVVLSAADVNALPDTTVIPDRTSQLINDSGFLTNAQVGAVLSVNGQVGAVVLDANDVSALPDTTVIPTKTSELINDAGFITSAQAAPVDSVNGYIGAVVLDAADVGAAPAAAGIPQGGAASYVLAKDTAVDYDVSWVAIPSAAWTREQLATNLFLYRQGNARFLIANGCTVTNPVFNLAAADRPPFSLSCFGLQGTTSSSRAACFMRVYDTGNVTFNTFSGAFLSAGDGWGNAFWTVD